MNAEVSVKAGRREWFGLAVLALPTFVVAIDLFVLMLALPALSRDLGANSVQQLWVVDMYGFILAGFLVTMGTLGDRIGRRRLLLFGAAAFAAASLLSAYATSPGMLIGARALLGLAGATLGPSTLALITNLFKDPKQQAAAFGVWGMTFTLGAVFGPVIGGVMLANFWWGSVFLLGVPVMILVLLVGPKVLPEYSHQGSGRLDPLSVVLSLATILPTIYGIKQLARNGWQAVPIIAVVVGVVFGALFLRRQRRLTDPLLDLRVIANRTIGTALTGQLAYSMIGGVTMLFMMLYFQLVRGMSTIEAGAALVPGMIAGSVGFMVGPKLAGKIRPAYIIAAGLVGTALVQLVFTSVGADSGTVLLIVGFAVFAFAGAPMAGLGTSLAVGSAPPEKAGAAGSLAQMANEFGSTLGIALLGTLGTTVYRVQVADGVPAGTPSGAAASARDSLAGATNAAQGLPADVGRTLLANAHKAFTDGMHTIAVVGAVLLAAAALLIVTRLKHVPPFGQAAAQPAPAEPATEEAAVAETELAH